MFFRLGKGITSIIYIFHLKEKPPPEKFKKIKGLVYFELLCVKLYSGVLKMAIGPPKFS